MRKLSVFLLLTISLIAFGNSYGTITNYQVDDASISKGYVSKQIWLSEFAMPKVEISGITFITSTLPKDAKPGDPNNFIASIGMDRKRPFLLVRIPAYNIGTDNKTNRVSSFTLNITETSAPANSAARTATDPINSVLNTGTWYKIGVTKTGLCKIDYNFIKSMGLNPANINPADIRIFGNGGNMLSEDLTIPRANDLIENAIQVSANSDNSFDNGEYALFYAVGPTGWTKDSTNKRFNHFNNLYSDTAYYFITFNQGSSPIHIDPQSSLGTGNVNVNDFNYYDVHDLDLLNPPGLGKQWYGEQFIEALGNTTQTFNFNTGPTTSCAHVIVQFGGTGAGSSFYYVNMNGEAIGTTTLTPTLPTLADVVMSLTSVSGNGACNPTSNISLQIVYQPYNSAASGYLDYIELNVRRRLVLTDDQMSFRDWNSVGAGKIATYNLEGANGNTVVWDITNPQRPVLMNGTLNGTTYTFTQEASILHEFVAMNNTNVNTPKYSGTVENQNLHGKPQTDLIIVTHPSFLKQAESLASYHRAHDYMRVEVATTTQVYNEFASGAQDLSAIRDFARMFYKRASSAADMPKYLLLFGGASYDYKNRVTNNSNFVPVFESAVSTNDLDAFSTDDFFGFLDDNEYIEDNSRTNVLDIGVGRFPARTEADANSLVNKVINYTKPNTLGPWRINATFTACISDGAGDHMGDAELMGSTLTAATTNLYNLDKVYQNAIPTIITPAGARSPNANAAINNDVYKGVFMMNYNGHGNTQVLSSERILTHDDYTNWNNATMLPFMVTATCDFGQFDHPQFVSAAEELVKLDGGGVIAMITTTQAVFADYNKPLNTQYITAQFTRNTDGTWNTFGDASRISKNRTYINTGTYSQEITNFRKFSLLGDPALTPDFPQYNVKFDSAIDGVNMLRTDSIRALGKYIMHGSVRDNDGNIMTNFNGTVYITFFDKSRDISTIVGTARTFKLQDVIVYKGRVTVNNGLFEFQFITPKDINYYYGKSKISTYADNGQIDAAGVDTSLYIGGYSSNPVLSTNPPVVRPYINDTLFQDGGITGTNTSLFVTLYSETGINVSGNELGHNMTAILDDNVESPYILNNYYQTAPDTYQYGYVSFPITGIPDGRHTITVKAWDVNDNSGTGRVDFTVVDGTVMAIQNLQNYPNPFSNSTRFVFEHNHPDEALDVQILIYNAAGGLVKDINEQITPSGSRTNEISWDGTDKNGERLPSGLYVYRLNITGKNFKSSAYQKLVIVR